MDINPGQSPNPVGSPIWPGTQFTGPLLAGNVVHSNGTGSLAVAGGYEGTANVGYVLMAQSQAITQATNGTVAGVFTTSIVIPAQSQIITIGIVGTATWSGGAATLGIGTTASATALTAAGAISVAALGPQPATPGTDATRIGNWIDVGDTDIQIVVTSTNTGTGTAQLFVTYIQGINNTVA